MTDLRLTFLGGASAIGASSILVEVADKTLLIDCGVRFKGSPLPDLSALDGKSLDAILVTHAHSDHTGGLAVVHEAFPGAPILATTPTLDLVRILQRDALRLMGTKDREGDAPYYTERQVESMLEATRAVRHLEKIPLGDLEVSFLPASHILGASMIHLATPAGNVLLTGDYSVAAQATVPALDRPRLPVDLVVTETTYGDRSHADRGAAENRLIERVREVVEGGGRILIPAFAIGRAQEVLLVLKRALRDGRLPEVPIFVDGMVRSVCDVYARHETYASAALAREIRAGRHPFYTDLIRPVSSPDDRRHVLTVSPSVIIASSGMLSGGASAFYAKEIAQTERDAILITGYQDEESPGRALLKLAETGGQRGSLRLGDEVVDVRCRFEAYSLSAHADRGQMAGLLAALRPKSAVLVHGDQVAKEGLARALAIGDVTFGEDGVSLTRRYSRRHVAVSREMSPALERDALAAMLGAFPGVKTLDLMAVAEAWYGRRPLGDEALRLGDALERFELARRDDERRTRLKVLAPSDPLESELKAENPKGKLLEWCAKHHLPAPERIASREGAMTVMELRLIHDGSTRTSGPWRALSEKAAEHLAARALLTTLTGRVDGEATTIGEDDEARLKLENPKGRVLETCTQNRWPAPKVDLVPVAGGYKARVSLSLSDGVALESPWFFSPRSRVAEQGAYGWLAAKTEGKIPGPAAASPPTDDAPDPRLFLNEQRQLGLLNDFGYDDLGRAGPPHAPEFLVRAWAKGPGGSQVTGDPEKAGNKKEAQRLAAASLVGQLVALHWFPPT
jgi:Cft2 family RNA processing exonuclease